MLLATSRSLTHHVAGAFLAALTVYSVLKYVFVQHPSFCRMTFMMEPPKFLNVPIFDENNQPGHQQDKTTNVLEATPTQRNYKLFMYSEFDFPQSSNPQLDLKDSMPVLFVPGNAGSYQQARSLASTCIRRQLRSLEAAKFVFYTVGFGEQLSGISGRLLSDQIDFVTKAIMRIKKNHPDQKGGIILIGHSVGGFITKAIFAQPNFPQDSVGLIISLAGPLTGLPLFFDHDVRIIYDRTNQHWNNIIANYDDKSRFVAVSITGGYLDRLVPPHLAMDPHFDISITTSALAGVWLPTDHVPITWCRELMQKISIVMSSIMDKRTTRLMPIERNQIIDILKNQLVGSDDILVKHPKLSTGNNWTSTKAVNIINNEFFYHDQRYRLKNELKILNLEQNESLFVLIEHVENLPQRWISSCDNKLDHANSKNKITCTNQIDLSSFARSLPSRFYEPQTSFLIIPSSLLHSNNMLSIIIDLVPDNDEVDGPASYRRMPESLTFFRMESKDYLRVIHVPTILEYIWYQMITIFTSKQSFIMPIEPRPGYSLHYIRLHLPNFQYFTQTFLVTLEAISCPKKIPERGMILFRAPWSFESYHSPLNNDDLSRLQISLRLMKTYHKTNMSESAYLELFLDGDCRYNLNLKLDFLDLFNIIVQHRLGSILTCLAMLLISAIKRDFRLISRYEKMSQLKMDSCNDKVHDLSFGGINISKLNLEPIVRFIVNLASMIMLLVTSSIIFNLLAPNLGYRESNVTDEVIIILSIYAYCSGALIASQFAMKILIYLLAGISFCFGILIGLIKNDRLDEKIIKKMDTSLLHITNNNGYPKNPQLTNDSTVKVRNDRSQNRFFNLDACNKTFDISGLILFIAIMLGVFWCSFWLSLATIMICMARSIKNSRNFTTSNHIMMTKPDGKGQVDISCLTSAISRLDINVTLLTVLCVLPTIPDALISLQDRQNLVSLTTSKMADYLVLTSVPALILAYMFMHKVYKLTIVPDQIDQLQDVHVKTVQNLRSLFFLPVLLIQSNIYFLSVTQLTTLFWLVY